MTVYATVLIYEQIQPKDDAYTKSGTPKLASALKKLASKGIKSSNIPIAEIIYLQTATGDCDYILQMKSENIENLMKAINHIRRIPQVVNTETHVGELI